MADRCVEIADPADPRLADYRDLRDVELRKHLEAEHGLFLAEGEKVVRRAVEAGFTPRSFLMAPRWLDGLADVLGHAPTRPATCVSEALAEEVTGFHVHRGALASLERRPLPPRRVGAGRRPVGPGARGHRRPHQRRRDLPLAARRSASTPCCSRRGAPTRSTAARSRSAMGAVFTLPWTRLPDWYDALPTLSAAGFTTVALTLADDAVADRGRRRRPRPGRAGARLGGPRPLAALGAVRRPPRDHPDAPRASTRSTSPPPPPSPATSPPAAEPRDSRRRARRSARGRPPRPTARRCWTKGYCPISVERGLVVGGDGGPQRAHGRAPTGARSIASSQRRPGIAAAPVRRVDAVPDLDHAVGVRRGVEAGLARRPPARPRPTARR